MSAGPDPLGQRETPAAGAPRGAAEETPLDASERAGSSSLGSLIAEISRDLSTLVQQELEFAKAEVRQSVKRAGRGAGLFTGAAFGAQMTLVFLSVAAWWALGEPLGRGWSGVIVAAVWAVVALVLALQGRQEVRRVRGLPETVDTVKKIPQALQGHEERNS